MPKKRFNAEQIVTLLRQIEVSIAQGKTAPVACRDLTDSKNWVIDQLLTITGCSNLQLFSAGAKAIRQNDSLKNGKVPNLG